MRLLRKATETYESVRKAYNSGRELGEIIFQTIFGEGVVPGESIESWMMNRSELHSKRQEIEQASREYGRVNSLAYGLGMKLRFKSLSRSKGIRSRMNIGDDITSYLKS